MKKRMKKYVLSDKIYQEDIKDEIELEKKVDKLDLNRHQKMLLNDYIACLKTANNRYAELSYLAGDHDMMRLLNKLGRLKRKCFFHN